MSRPAGPQQTILLILFSNTVMPALLGFVAYSGGHRGVAPSATIAYSLAGIAFLLAIGLSFRLGEQGSIQDFQRQVVVTLAVSEFGAFVGFALIGLADWTQYIPFALGTIAINVLFILPRVLAYLRTQ